MTFLRMRNSLIVVAISMATFFVHGADMKQDMGKTADDMYKGVSDNFGNTKKITDNMVAPISGSSDMKTLDGKTAFSGKAVCKGSSEYAKYIIQPQGNGDVVLLNLFQDANMDGKIDKTISAGWRMSAVCGNGYMYCTDPDNAATCNGYKWTGDPLGKTSASITELGGCYCINNKCGQSLVWRNLPQVVRDIGTGIAGALSAANPWYTLSDVKIDGIQGTLVGGDTGSCVVGDTTGMISNTNIKTSTTYLDNPKKMTNDAAAQVNVNQTYSTLKNGSVNAKESEEIRSCEVSRNVAIDEPKLSEIVTFEGGEGQIIQCGSDCLTLAIGRIGDNYLRGGSCTYYDYLSKFYVKDASRIKTATLVQTKFDDWLQLWAGSSVIYSAPYNWVGEGPVPGACELSTEWQFSPNLDFKKFVSNNGPLVFRTRVAVGGEGEAYALLKITADTSCRPGNESIFNGCRAYEDDNTCTLVEESVDGVKTFIEGIKTGLTPLPQTTSLQGNFCSVPVTKPWFKKKRTYRCNRKAPIDLSKAKERSKYIKENVTFNQFKDKQFHNNGSVKFDQGPLYFDGLPTVGECTSVCKTRTTVNGASMSLGGSVSGKQTAPSYNFYYHQCTKDNVCPAEPGETVVKACQCLDEFADAAAIMQIIRQAGQDMICSSGETKGPNWSK